MESSPLIILEPNEQIKIGDFCVSEMRHNNNVENKHPKKRGFLYFIWIIDLIYYISIHPPRLCLTIDG